MDPTMRMLHASITFARPDVNGGSGSAAARSISKRQSVAKTWFAEPLVGQTLFCPTIR
jgi:hypothetical protein